MSLTAAEVAEIVKLVEQSGFDELTLEVDGLKLSLRRNGAGSVNVSGAEAAGVAQASAPAPVAAAAPVMAANLAPAPSPPIPADPNLADIRSPLLGTFYRAPKPGAPAFVELGDSVEENTVVAIIEVMKLMNTVRAGVRGTVSEILVSDGVLVEFEQPLIRVRKSS